MVEVHAVEPKDVVSGSMEAAQEIPSESFQETANAQGAGRVDTYQDCGVSVVVQEFKTVLPERPGKTPLVLQGTKLTSHQPIHAGPHSVSPTQDEIVKKKMRNVLEVQFIEPNECDGYFPSYSERN